MNSSHDHVLTPRNSAFPAAGRTGARSVSASRQVQDWTRNLGAGSGGWDRVITEDRTALPAFSSRGIRWDILTGTLALLLLLFVGVLFADLENLRAGSERVGKLSAGIEALEDSNARLGERLSVAMRHPVLNRKAEEEAVEYSTVVFLTDIPEM